MTGIPYYTAPIEEPIIQVEGESERLWEARQVIYLTMNAMKLALQRYRFTMEADSVVGVFESIAEAMAPMIAHESARLSEVGLDHSIYPTSYKGFCEDLSEYLSDAQIKRIESGIDALAALKTEELLEGLRKRSVAKNPATYEAKGEPL